MSKLKAFTLIELLIVVAIIAILAAIAVPNFLEAQTRSKVSRVKSDQRTLATAIEAYAVDYNLPPPASGEATSFVNGTPGSAIRFGSSIITGTLGPWITTPIAYTSTFLLQDVFVKDGDFNGDFEPIFSYHSYEYRWGSRGDLDPDQGEGSNEDLTGNQFLRLYGRWRLISIGPDASYNNNEFGNGVVAAGAGPIGVGLPYDPTNGTVSSGTIIRSQNGEPTDWKLASESELASEQ